MANTQQTEVLTPLDLIMPKTYIQALLTFPTTSVASIIQRLQPGLDLTAKQVPWISGRLFQANSGPDGAPNIEVRWDADDKGPEVVDMGTIAESYEAMAEKGMLPETLPAGAWLVAGLPEEMTETSGPKAFVAGLFRFADHRGVGLCIGVHHNCVDGTGFSELVGLWAQNMAGENSVGLHLTGRRDRLSEALSGLRDVEASSLEALLASHPEYSMAPPTFPSSFPACTSKLFTISVAHIQAHAKESAGHESQSINTLLSGLLWSCVTRARLQGSEAASLFAKSRMAMAVNGRPRIASDFSPSQEPYLGNIVLYALSEMSSEDLFSAGMDANGKFDRVCSAITTSSAPTKVDSDYVAEVYELVNKAKDYRGIFVGWDLFQSRDLTITSWANLDFYAMDFGDGLGRPEFLRFPYTEADGVCIILPRRRASTEGVSEIIEVVVMLRKDNMAILEKDNVWKTLTV